MSHTVQFSRPETPTRVSRMFIPTEESGSIRHIRRLEALGYTIVDISPPLAEYTGLPADSDAVLASA